MSTDWCRCLVILSDSGINSGKAPKADLDKSSDLGIDVKFMLP